MSTSKDIRTLCASCRAEYDLAGYVTVKIWAKNKEECDHCRVRNGWTYEVRDLYEVPEKPKKKRRRKKKKKHLRSSVGESAENSQFRCREFESRRR